MLVSRNKKIRLFLSLLILFVMLMSLSVPASAKTKKPALNYKKKTVTINNLKATDDHSFTLQLNNAKGTSYAYTSKKSIATVKRKSKNQFTVTAKKKGTATITVRNRRKNYRCKVTVKKGSLYSIINSGKKVSMKNQMETGEFDTEEAKKNEVVRKEIKRIAKKVNKSMTERQAFDIIFRTIAKDYSYDNEYYTENHSKGLYEVIKTKSGVCIHYAGMLEKCCGYVGISCPIIMGTADGVGHAWNLVQFSDEEYECDLTAYDTGCKGQDICELSLYGYANRTTTNYGVYVEYYW